MKRILDKELLGDLNDDNKEFVDEGLTEIIDHFEFLMELANGAIPDSKSENKIPENEWGQYCFDGDFEELFNSYLGQLYDLGDEHVQNNGNYMEKFIWIG